MKKHLSAGVSLLLLVAAPEAFAWDEEGHQVVAAIAQHHLTPEAREGIQLLLGSAHLQDRDVAAWADDLRSSQPSTKPWHFVTARARIAPSERLKPSATSSPIPP
jgi:hypothetical protein